MFGRKYKGRRVLVQLPDMTIRGSVVRFGKHDLCLICAEALNAQGEGKPIDGELLIARRSIEWIQVP